MKTTRLVLLLILLLIAATISVIVVFLKNPVNNSTTPIKNENRVIQDEGNSAVKAKLIKVSNPTPNQLVKSPLTIEGEARGTWYFEAVFPVSLYDSNENLIAKGSAFTKSDWMTEEFVPFSATLTFTTPTTETGILVLEKSNPSDLPENSDELIIPVRFR